jgi:hypothetical protein
MPGGISVPEAEGVELMQMPPVSVCHHQVSTTTHFSLPTTLLNQCQASTLMGSPWEESTVETWLCLISHLISNEPRVRRELRSYFSTCSSPYFSNNPMAVGAAYNWLIFRRWTAFQYRPVGKTRINYVSIWDPPSLQSETILNYASTTHREDSQLGNEQSL